MSIGTIAERGQVVQAIAPVDLSDGANSGDWVNLENYGGLDIVVVTAAGTAGDDAVITVEQATDNAGTDNKALNFSRVYEKRGATALSAVAEFTEVELSTTNATGSVTGRNSGNENTVTNLTDAENQVMYVIPIEAEDLDDGFTHVQVSIADVGTNEQLGVAVYVLRDARYPGEPAIGAID